MARKYIRDTAGRFSGGGGKVSSGRGGKGGQPKANTKTPAPSPAKAATSKGANAIKAGPRVPPRMESKPAGNKLNSAERAYAEIKAQKSKFKSDRKVIEEMTRRGFLKGNDPQGQMIRIARSARMKQGGTY
jgi:hypothetical protein